MVPTGRPFAVARCAWQQSSTIAMLCFRRDRFERVHVGRLAVQMDRAGSPVSVGDGSRDGVADRASGARGSMSANTGPRAGHHDGQRRCTPAESGVVMTSSPGPMPSARSVERDRIGTACRRRRRSARRIAAANSASKASTSGPRMNQPRAIDPFDRGADVGRVVARHERQERYAGHVKPPAARPRCPQATYRSNAPDRTRWSAGVRRASATGGRPAGHAPELRRVGVEAADVDGFLVRRPVDVTRRVPLPAILDEQRGQIAMADRAIAADVEDLAVARVDRARAQKRVRGVVDEHEIAELRAVTVDFNRLVFDRQADEPPDEALSIVT